jgi:hypothetical protein
LFLNIKSYKKTIEKIIKIKKMKIRPVDQAKIIVMEKTTMDSLINFKNDNITFEENILTWL